MALRRGLAVLLAVEIALLPVAFGAPAADEASAVPKVPAAPADPPAQTIEQTADAGVEAEVAADDDDDDDDDELDGDEEEITVVVKRQPGSAHVLGAAELDRFERDDVHKVLASIPGVYTREEDGYGLRPNIGMRGAASERSAKIALLEDGILIAPAPYAAPAAYYFPLMTRMSGVEVTKGPAAIAYGPNTVGGALNLTTRPIPLDPEGFLDVAGGNDLYGKLHGGYGRSWELFGFLVEGAKLRSSGFKQLDGGGDTGFDKNDLSLKARVNTRRGAGAGAYHQLTLKLGYGDEVSDETYTGLSDADFAATPYRRYAGTQLDQLDWRHLLGQVTHKTVFGGGITIATTAYRHQFSRDWRKLNGFATDRSLAEILASPDDGNNAVFYAVLTGAADSSSPSETLLVGTNERDYVSQGVQTTATAQRRWFGLAHGLELGLRVHEDRADRYHTEDRYQMIGGALLPSGGATTITRDGRGGARALAAYYKHQATIGDVRVTAGVRGELVFTRWIDHADPTMNDSASYAVLIPGAGVHYQVTPELALLGGAHRGFVPVAPGEADDAAPEESINYEAGARWASPWLAAEAIGFFSDYSNLKGTCTFSSGCDIMQIDDEFDGGAVRILGVEAQAAVEPRRGKLRFPLSVTYTYSRSSFQDAFVSANPEWGDVQVGDELPYLPAHQLSTQAGVRASRWELAATWRYTSTMRDIAGQGATAAGERTDASNVLDLAANLNLRGWGKAYLTINNVLDDAAIVSRRPYGARPGAPRLFILGFKRTF